MSNKFIIRNLENEKRRIDKLIAKLRKEDALKTSEKLLGVIKETRNSIITKEDIKQEVLQTFEYSFYRKGNVIECRLKDGSSHVVGVGIAKCHDEDLFSEGVGCSLAERRAIVDYYSKIERLETKEYS